MILRLGALAAALAAVAATAFADSDQIRTIRVGLHYGPTAVPAVRVSGEGAARGETNVVSFSGDVTAAARGREIILSRDGEETPLGRWAELTPTGRDPWLELEDTPYRGAIRLDVAGEGRLRVINIVDIEDYVRGVVPNEMFSDREACKAQAVVSRTYLVYVRDAEHKHQADGFDICATGHCQVYRGVDSERPVSDEATQATGGQLLTYQGKPIFAAYHANAGGVTQTVDEAWPGSIRRDFPYLCQVDSPYDGEAGSVTGMGWCYRWEREVSGAEIAQRLKARGKDVGDVRELAALTVTGTGRVRELGVVGAAGRVRLTTPTEVREVLGAPSDRLTIEKLPPDVASDASAPKPSFRLTGWGNGHGVGLSQHGAFAMSKAGYRYDQILGHFYRGVDLTEDYGRGPSHPLAPPEVKITAAQPAPAPAPAG